MKYFKIIVLVLLGSLGLSCSLQIPVDIDEGKFRFENFKVLNGPQLESISLLCYRKKPSDWFGARQYEAGEHKLLVKAEIEPKRQAYVTFNVKLEASHNYILNRTIEGESISIWIQDIDSGLKVSTIETTQLELINIHKYIYYAKEEKKACEASSI
mgnify:CR=1 FL=1